MDLLIRTSISTQNMGKITVFALDSCPFCKKAKELLASKGVHFDVISLTQTPEWRPLMYLLTKGRSSVPEIFFSDKLIGGYEDLQALNDSGRLDTLIRECVESTDSPDFPPELRKPASDEFLQIVPVELREKWQQYLEVLDGNLGGTPDRPVSSLLIMLETPLEMVVLCTAGPGKSVYKVGAGGEKGHEGGEEKLYCQVAIEKKETLFLDGPDNFPPGLHDNEDYKKFGYGYYLGAPWMVGQVKGTVVAMETKPGILKESQKILIEELRDTLERDLSNYLTGPNF